MDKQIENQVQKVKNLLLEEPLVKEYLSLKEQLKNDTYIKELNEKINNAKKNMVKNSSDKVLFEQYKAEYESLENEYNNYPLIVNYNSTSEELGDILVKIKEILE